MGFFEDYGRSGASESLDKIPKLAIELGKLNQEAAGQRFRAAVDIEKISMERESLALQKEQAASANALREQQTRKAKIEAEELQKKTEWLDGSGKLELDPIFLRLPKAAQKTIYDYARSEGLLNENGEIKRRHKIDILNTLNTDYSKFDSLLRQPMIQEAEASVKVAIDELEKEKGKGIKANPEKIAELTSAVRVAHTNYMQQKGQLDKAAEEVLKLQSETEKSKLKKDEFESWKEAVTREKGRPPMAAEILEWKKSSTTGSTRMEGQAKVGTVGQVNRELAGRWFASAKENVQGNSEAAKILEGIQISLGSTDQFGGSVNDARLQEALTPEQRKAYVWQKTKAQDYAGNGMNPAAAVNRAEAEWNAKNPPKGTPKIPEGFEPDIDPSTGRQRTSGGKPVYINKKTKKAFIP